MRNSAMKVCKKCGANRAISAFKSDIRYVATCCFCRNKYKKVAINRRSPQLIRYYKISRINPEEIREYHRNYKRDYRERLRQNKLSTIN